MAFALKRAEIDEAQVGYCRLMAKPVDRRGPSILQLILGQSLTKKELKQFGWREIFQTGGTADLPQEFAWCRDARCSSRWVVSTLLFYYPRDSNAVFSLSNQLALISHGG